ncbi:MAG: winged helix-turn-helix domain-containing protein [Alphaproteobacteria bacterium]
MYSINKDMHTIFKALGYKTRTDILQEIKDNPEMTLSKLSDKFKMSIQTLRFHVQELKNAKLIISRKKNGSVCFIFNKKHLESAFKNAKKILF